MVPQIAKKRKKMSCRLVNMCYTKIPVHLIHQDFPTMLIILASAQTSSVKTAMSSLYRMIGK